MAQPVNNRYLLYAFIALLLIVAGIQWWQSSKTDVGAIRSTAIEPVDSQKVSRIEVVPELDTAKAFNLVPTDSGWQVRESPEATFNKKRFKRAMEDLKAGIPISHLVSRKKSDWPNYKVDSGGTLLRIYQQGQLHDAAILGKMNFNEKQTATTYIRNIDDPSVYAVSAYLKGSLKGKRSEWTQKGGRGPGGRQLSPRMRRKLRQMRQQRQ
jgi:hypothetical protein